MAGQIPGVPDGWELVRIGIPNDGDWRISMEGEAEVSQANCITVWPIIRKIEKPAKYRPFKDAEEFKPHRDRWWYRDDKDGRRRHFPPASYSDKTHNGAAWQHRFETCFFDDGTPFGAKIDE